MFIDLIVQPHTKRMFLVFLRTKYKTYEIKILTRTCSTWGVLINFCVRGRAVEHSQDSDTGTGYHFVEIGFMTGSIPYISFLTPKGRFRPFALCECDSNRLDGNISTFFYRFLTKFPLQSTILPEGTKGQGIV